MQTLLHPLVVHLYPIKHTRLDTPITSLQLPTATGGNGTITHTLTPSTFPTGISYNAVLTISLKVHQLLFQQQQSTHTPQWIKMTMMLASPSPSQ